jgi:hypothetical protein
VIEALKVVLAADQFPERPARGGVCRALADRRPDASCRGAQAQPVSTIMRTASTAETTLSGKSRPAFQAARPGQTRCENQSEWEAESKTKSSSHPIWDIYLAV